MKRVHVYRPLNESVVLCLSHKSLKYPQSHVFLKLILIERNSSIFFFLSTRLGPIINKDIDNKELSWYFPDYYCFFFGIVEIIKFIFLFQNNRKCYNRKELKLIDLQTIFQATVDFEINSVLYFSMAFRLIVRLVPLCSIHEVYNTFITNKNINKSTLPEIWTVQDCMNYKVHVYARPSWFSISISINRLNF